MTAPWEKYAIKSDDTGPWEKYAHVESSSKEVGRFVDPQPEVDAAAMNEPGWRGGMRSVLQGATFGWGDEAVAGAVALMASANGEDFGDVYSDVLKLERQKLEEHRRKYPKSAALGEISGAIANPASRFGAGAPKTAGAIGGAVYGAGSGEGDGKLQGAATGVALGWAVPAVLQGAGKTANYVSKTRPARIVQKELNRLTKTGADISGEIAGLGPDARLVDVLPDLADRIGQTPGGRPTLAKFLEDRARGQKSRILGSLSNLTRSTKEYWDNIWALEAKRAADAKPLYDEAFSAPFRLNKEISSKVNLLRKGVPSAWRRAQKIAALDGVELPKDMPDSMTLEQLNWFKQGIDDALPTLWKSSSQVARRVRDLKNGLLENLDDAVPAYSSARKAWAGPSSMIQAQEAGRKVLGKDFEFTAKQLEKMSDSEKEAFVVGAVRAIRDKVMMAQDTGNAVRKFQPLLRERLRPTFPDEESYRQFIKVMDNEDTFAFVKNTVLGGSPTQKRIAGAADLTGIALDIGQGRFVGATVKAIQKLVHIGSKRGISDKTAKDVAEMLIRETDAESVQRILNQSGVVGPEANKIIRMVTTSAVSAKNTGQQ